MYLKSNEEYSLEAIDRLAKDPIVDYITKWVGEVREVSRLVGLESGDKDNNPDKRIKKMLGDLEKTITKRFGLNLSFIFEPNSNYILYIPVSDMGATASRSEIYYEFLDEYYNKKTKETMAEDFYKKIYESAKETRKQLQNSDKLTVDFSKAKISGLGKLTSGMIHIDPSYLFRYKLTDKEVTAVIMHEIGHAFNGHAYINRTFGSVLSTMEGMLAVKSDKKKILNLANELFGSDLKSGEELIYSIVKGEFVNYDKNLYTLTNDESGADQFTTRFGLGAELSLGLSKLYGVSTEGRENSAAITIAYGDAHSDFRKFLTSLILPYIIALIFPMGSSVAIIISVLNLYNSYYTFKIIVLGIMHIISNGRYKQQESKSNLSYADVEEFTYDRIPDRINRIKLDLVRQLRTLNLDKKEKARIIDAIAVVSKQVKIFKNSPIFNDTELNTVFNAMFVGFDGISKREFLIKIEELTENDLHHQQEKFKQLLG